MQYSYLGELNSQRRNFEFTASQRGGFAFTQTGAWPGSFALMYRGPEVVTEPHSFCIRLCLFFMEMLLTVPLRNDCERPNFFRLLLIVSHHCHLCFQHTQAHTHRSTHMHTFLHLPEKFVHSQKLLCDVFR